MGCLASRPSNVELHLVPGGGNDGKTKVKYYGKDPSTVRLVPLECDAAKKKNNGDTVKNEKNNVDSSKATAGGGGGGGTYADSEAPNTLDIGRGMKTPGPLLGNRQALVEEWDRLEQESSSRKMEGDNNKMVVS